MPNSRRKPIDRSPFTRVVEQRGEGPLHSHVVRCGFRLREPRGTGDELVVLATCGAMVPETLAAADVLEEEEGVDSLVLCLLVARSSLPPLTLREDGASARR